jgi:hypothetical protein
MDGGSIAANRCVVPSFGSHMPHAPSNSFLKNYTSDWVMSLMWGLVVGTASPIPYFYPLFFLAVLTHRCGRDFERCVIIVPPLLFSGFGNSIVKKVLCEVRQGLGAVL